jgi:hypothetical protein
MKAETTRGTFTASFRRRKRLQAAADDRAASRPLWVKMRPGPARQARPLSPYNPTFGRPKKRLEVVDRITEGIETRRAETIWLGERSGESQVRMSGRAPAYLWANSCTQLPDTSDRFCGFTKKAPAADGKGFLMATTESAQSWAASTRFALLRFGDERRVGRPGSVAVSSASTCSALASSNLLCSWPV